MKLPTLLTLLTLSLTVLASPDPHAAALKATKKTTRTRTDKKSTKDPPRPTVVNCDGQPFVETECTKRRAALGCQCYSNVRYIHSPLSRSEVYCVCADTGVCDRLVARCFMAIVLILRRVRWRYVYIFFSFSCFCLGFVGCEAVQWWLVE